jgi:hypothetical protein
MFLQSIVLRLICLQSFMVGRLPEGAFECHTLVEKTPEFNNNILAVSTFNATHMSAFVSLKILHQ